MNDLNIKYDQLKAQIKTYIHNMSEISNNINELQKNNENEYYNIEIDDLERRKKRIMKLIFTKNNELKKIEKKKDNLLKKIKEQNFEISRCPDGWNTDYNNPYEGLVIRCLECGEEKDFTKWMKRAKKFKCNNCSENKRLTMEKEARKKKYSEFLELALNSYPKAKLRKPIQGNFYEDIHLTCEHSTDFTICISKLDPKISKWCDCPKCVEERGEKNNPNRMQLNHYKKKYIKQTNYMYICIKNLLTNADRAGLELLSTKWIGENEYYDFRCLVCGRKLKYKGEAFTQVFLDLNKYSKPREKGGCFKKCFETYKKGKTFLTRHISEQKINEIIKNGCSDERSVV